MGGLREASTVLRFVAHRPWARVEMASPWRVLHAAAWLMPGGGWPSEGCCRMRGVAGLPGRSRGWIPVTGA